MTVAIGVTMPQQLLYPSPAVRASISGDGLVLLDTDGGVVLSSNHVGARIWTLVAERCTIVEIAAQLAAEYDVSVDRAREDVRRFVSDLVSRGIVREEVRL